MAKIGTMELIVILIVALFAIGPERLPRAARVLGRSLRDFRKYMNEATSELREASAARDEVKAEIDDPTRAAAASASTRASAEPKSTTDNRQEEPKNG